MGVKIPWWKKLFSYITEIHLESTASPYNPHLYVSLKNGRLMLSTQNAIYSYSDKYDNFRQAFNLIDMSKANDMLILGFGLGSIPIIIEKKMKRHLHYTGVEIDEEVVRLVSNYVLPDLKSNIDVVIADASAYVEMATTQFDIIAMDVFESDFIPDRFESKEFLLTLKSLLAKDGILLYNRLAYTTEDVEHSTFFFDGIFKEVFPKAHCIPVKGNFMLLNRSDVMK